MRKFTTFSERINFEIKSFLNFPKNSGERKELEKRVIAGLFGERSTNDHLPIREITNKERYLLSIFRYHFEIKKSLDRIKMALGFILKTRTNNLDQISYHYEHFLNETYIFSERMNSFLAFVIKRSKKMNLKKDFQNLQGIKQRFNDTLSDLILRRGEDVHVQHYKNDKIDQIGALNLLCDEFDYLRVYRDQTFRNFKKKVLLEVRGNLKTFQNFFEKDLYKRIEHLIF